MIRAKVSIKLDKLKNAKSAIDKATNRGAYNGAVMIRDLASELAPKETGDLSRSGSIKGGDRAKSYRVTFGEGLPDNRAFAQEYGTIYNAAQPYLTPAAKEIDVRAEIEKEINKVI